MTIGFPQNKQTALTGQAGINLVSTIINNEFKWIFRPNHNETDFGIDAYLDIVTEDNFVTGQSIALQIKSGESFFKSKSKNGFNFYGEIKHLNYYMNSQIPILIIICDVNKRKCYWVHFDGNRIERTKSGWKINIPSLNFFNASKKKEIQSLLPPPVDYSDYLNDQWDFNTILKGFDTILYTIDRNDIEKKNFIPLREFFERLQTNDSLFQSLQGKIEINIFGYDGDKRELFEIREIRKWFKKAEAKIKPWFFFLNTKPPANGFKLLMASVCNAKVINNDVERMSGYELADQMLKGNQIPQMAIKLDTKLMQPFLENNFLRLNEITEYLGMSISDNKKICEGISVIMDIN